MLQGFCSLVVKAVLVGRPCVCARISLSATTLACQRSAGMRTRTVRNASFFLDAVRLDDGSATAAGMGQCEGLVRRGPECEIVRFKLRSLALASEI